MTVCMLHAMCCWYFHQCSFSSFPSFPLHLTLERKSKMQFTNVTVCGVLDFPSIVHLLFRSGLYRHHRHRNIIIIVRRLFFSSLLHNIISINQHKTFRLTHYLIALLYFSDPLRFLYFFVRWGTRPRTNMSNTYAMLWMHKILHHRHHHFYVCQCATAS